MFTVEEFAEHMAMSVDDVDQALMRSRMREAQALIRQALPSLGDDVSAWPENAVVVALRVVARGYERAVSGSPFGAESVARTSGPFSETVSYGSQSSGNALWLTKEDKRLLGVGRGAYAVDLTPPYALREYGPDLWRSTTERW
ncbi:hypothetical protein NQ028_06565 [Corynebacterium phoceense]|uniref:hypothetical protein n=1 Tax=Corynebacterium phoceense TaxID=1686286 RepID=UPI00211B8E26|nr:hypothetical protein [Corynebacterium phoceense]MCQ9340808.1 hypothetical protein [Corynebacterium phoceense]